MTREPFAITADALHAFADGQLGEAERAAVERHLAAHPEAAAEVAAWQRQNEALRALNPATSNESVPPRLSPHRIAHDVRSARRRSIANIAAAIVLVALGGSIGWFGRDYMTPTRAASDYLIEAAVTAHSLYVKEKSRAVEVATSMGPYQVLVNNAAILRAAAIEDTSLEDYMAVINVNQIGSCR